MNTYEQYLASPHKTAWMQKDDYEAIQLDALEHAASLLTANADSPTRGFNAIHRLIVKLKSKTVAAMPTKKTETPRTHDA
jgi:hypothetical protein